MTPSEDDRAVVGPATLLAHLEGRETLEALYQTWEALKRSHEAVQARVTQERRALEHQGAFLLGAVREAGGLPSDSGHESALVRPAALQSFLAEAESRLVEARRTLEEGLALEQASHAQALGALRGRLTAQVRRYREKVKPCLKLYLRPLGGEQSILHLERVGGDEAVLLLHTLTGKIPSRYDFLFDDSTEDVSLSPSPLYPDEGVSSAMTRPQGRALAEFIMRASGEILPIKGFLPLLVPRPDGGVDFFRFLQRGPVMEVEALEGDGFRPLLMRTEAERVAGLLLRLQLQGQVSLEIQTG